MAAAVLESERDDDELIALVHVLDTTPGGRIDRWWQANPRRRVSRYPMVMVDSGAQTWDASKRGPTSNRQQLLDLIEPQTEAGSVVELDAYYERRPDGRAELVVEIENHGADIETATDPTLTLISYRARYFSYRGRSRIMRGPSRSRSIPIAGLKSGERIELRPGHTSSARPGDTWSGVAVVLEHRPDPERMSWEALQSDLADWAKPGTPTPVPTATPTLSPTPWPTPTPIGTAPWEHLAGSEKDGNPYYLTTRIGRELDHFGQAGSQPYTAAVYAFRDSQAPSPASDLPAQIPIADYQDVGPVFGLAWDQTRQTLFAGAFHPGGYLEATLPDSLGTIYRLDLKNPAPMPWMRLPADPVATPEPFRMGEAWVSGLGDLELSRDGTELFAVNLLDRRIYRLDAEKGSILGSVANGAAAEPWADEARPFALAWRSGWLYHGLVYSAEASPGALPRGHVYRSRADGSGMQELLRFDLDYPRPEPWRGWGEVNAVRQQPVMIDLAFKDDETMLIGMRARGWFPSGDLLRARRQPDGSWSVETQNRHYAASFGTGQDLTGSLAQTVDGSGVVASGRTFGGACDDAYVAVWLDHDSGQVDGPLSGMSYLSLENCESARPSGDIEAFVVPERPSPTPTASATSRPPATPTAAKTLIPGRRPWEPIYLPFLGRAVCARHVALEVAILVDTSTSMLQTVGDGDSKLDVVQRSLIALAEGIDAGASRQQAGTAAKLGLVAFNEIGTVLLPLSQDRQALIDSIDALDAEVASGSRFDVGLEFGVQLLLASRAERGNATRSVLLMLSDGLHSGPTPKPAIEAMARDARAAGILIYTLGIGLPGEAGRSGGVDSELLRALAGDSGRYIGTVEAEALSSIMTSLAEEVACPAAP